MAPDPSQRVIHGLLGGALGALLGFGGSLSVSATESNDLILWVAGGALIGAGLAAWKLERFWEEGWWWW